MSKLKISLEEAQELKIKLDNALLALNEIIEQAQSVGLSTQYNMSDVVSKDGKKLFIGLKQTISIKI